MKYTIEELLYLDDKWLGGTPWKVCPICERLGIRHLYCSICGLPLMKKDEVQGHGPFVHHIDCNPKNLPTIPIKYDILTGEELCP
jgi:hypothetical protein